MRTIAPEWLPRINMMATNKVLPDQSAPVITSLSPVANVVQSPSCGCLSSTWQYECQTRPSTQHPEGVWLYYPVCQLVPSIGSIDVLEIFQDTHPDGHCSSDRDILRTGRHAGGSNHNSGLPSLGKDDAHLSGIPVKDKLISTQLTSDLFPIQLFEKLVQYLLNTVTQGMFNMQRSDPTRSSSALNLTDFCRCVTLLHVAVRFWTIFHHSTKLLRQSFVSFFFSQG